MYESFHLLCLICLFEVLWMSCHFYALDLVQLTKKENLILLISCKKKPMISERNSKLTFVIYKDVFEDSAGIQIGHIYFR